VPVPEVVPPVVALPEPLLVPEVEPPELEPVWAEAGRLKGAMAVSAKALAQTILDKLESFMVKIPVIFKIIVSFQCLKVEL
jgi:hypothetical protein